MTLKGLDDLDRYILHELQSDARHTSSKDVAERMDVSPSTVRKRIQRLEEEGVIVGYRAEIDFSRAGYQLRVQIVCTAPIPDQEELVDRIVEIDGVVSVREIAAGEENLFVSVIATDDDDLTRIATELSRLGLDVSDEEIIRGERFGTYHGFGDAENE